MSKDLMREILEKNLFEAGRRKSLYNGTYIKLNSDTTKWFIDEALSAFKDLIVSELEKEKKIRFLTKDKLTEQLDWVNGHKAGVDDCIERVKKL